LADVFISYARENVEQARHLAEALEFQGWNVWWDPNIRSGLDFDEEIERQLTAAKCVVVLWSVHAIRSAYVRGEAREALARHKLVSIVVDNSQAPLDLRSIQAIMLTDWSGLADSADFQRLLHDIRTLVGVPTYRDRLPDGSVGPEMVIVPAGEFWMGSPEGEAGRNTNEGPRHRVPIPNRFGIGRFAVTFEEYDRFAVATGRDSPHDSWGRGRLPVTDVSWDDAAAYSIWLSDQTGMAYRLSSEAEWEYAARAGTQGPFSFEGPLTPERANYNGEGDLPQVGSRFRGRTVLVDCFEPNAFGLYQMHGNVWEWVTDRRHDSYEGAPDDGGAWLERAGRGIDNTLSILGGTAWHPNPRMLRGGAWNTKANGLRSASRFWQQATHRHFNIGFRIAQTL
jgi:formylglycine-generating enzyme required for sulfatase activity